MFDQLSAQPKDKILSLMQAFRNDPRTGKIDLGVGVYKDASGHTPIMRAVKAAEQRLWQEETTKSYVALAGDPGFAEAMRDLVLGDTLPADQVAAISTPGGTGAVRLGFELARMANPDLRVFCSDPTWPNHLAILEYLGIETQSYHYFDPDTGGVDFDAMMHDLKAARAGDLVLLHGCCHNPTGANLNPVQWRDVVDLLNDLGAVPMIDIAYQGFGDGLAEDAAATRLVAGACPETLIAGSCSKNFGIYRERTGILMATGQDSRTSAMTQENMNALNRLTYSFPPDHGARLVTMVLNDTALSADWQAELEEIRTGMLRLRQQLAEELRRACGSDRYGFLAQHRGMFSRLGVGPDMVEKLRVDHGIYMVGDSRMNMAGLNSETVPVLARAIAGLGE